MPIPEALINDGCTTYEDGHWDTVVMNKIKGIHERGDFHDLEEISFQGEEGSIYDISSALGIEGIRDLDLIEIAPLMPKAFQKKAAIYREWGLGFSLTEKKEIELEVQNNGQKARIFFGTNEYQKESFVSSSDGSFDCFPRNLLCLMGAMMVLPEDMLTDLSQSGIVVIEQKQGFPRFINFVRALALPGWVFEELGLKPPTNPAKPDTLYPVDKEGRFELPTKVIKPLGLLIGNIDSSIHSYGK